MEIFIHGGGGGGGGDGVGVGGHSRKNSGWTGLGFLPLPV